MGPRDALPDTPWVAALDAALRALAETGWVVAGPPRSGGPYLEWELVRADRGGSERAPIENYLVRLEPGRGLLLFLHGNTDAGAFNISMAAPLARVIDLDLLEAAPPVVPGGLPALLRMLLRNCAPNRYGLT